MRIGICGPINPKFLEDFLHKGQLIPDINKSSNAVNTYVLELLRMGHEVTIITSSVPGGSKDIVLEGDNIRIHIVHSSPGVFYSHALSRVYMIYRLKRVVRMYLKDIDVLHAQWTYDYALAAKSFESVIPVFCTVRDWCPYIMSIQKGLKKIQWFVYYLIFKRVMRSKRIHFIANSDYTFNCIKTSYPSKDVSIIYNPIDKKYVLSNKLYQIKNPTFISIAGDLSEGRKNIGTLLEAFNLFRKKHNNSVLKLAGEEYGIKQIYNNSELLEGVEFLGLVDHDALIKEIDNCTCLVHPSIEETFGNILIEGMARCVVVIGGKDSGAVPQVLDNGRLGILCNVKDKESLFEAMELSCDPANSAMLIARSTEALKEKYRSDKIAEQHLRLYTR